MNFKERRRKESKKKVRVSPKLWTNDKCVNIRWKLGNDR